MHEGAIFSLCALKDGSIVSGGGKDGRLVFLDPELEPTGEEMAVGERYGGVRQISEARGSQLLVGTTKNSILVGSLPLGLSPVILGHLEEVWACAGHPTLPQFITAGFEGFVYLWDSMAHSLVRSKEIGVSLRKTALDQPELTEILLRRSPSRVSAFPPTERSSWSAWSRVSGSFWTPCCRRCCRRTRTEMKRSKTSSSPRTARCWPSPRGTTQSTFTRCPRTSPNTAESVDAW